MDTARASAIVARDGGAPADVDGHRSRPVSPSGFWSSAEQPTRSQRKFPAWVFITGMLLALAAVMALSLELQPTAWSTAAWWPTAGIAIGLGVRFSRRYTWALAVAVGAVTLSVLLWSGTPPAPAITLTVLASVEMLVGTLLLRGRQDRWPTLSSLRDLFAFLLTATAAAVLYGVSTWGASLLLGYPEGAWDRLLTSTPGQAAGILLITPLFMDLPRRRGLATHAETAAQVFVALSVAIGVFVVNDGLSLGFLTFLPLAWAALRMSTRLLSLVTLAIAIVASVASFEDTGPFGFDRWGMTAASLTLQLFNISMVVIFLVVSLAVGAERDTSLRLSESEDLFVKSFNSSVAGKLMVTRGPVHWTVQRSNPSARELLPWLTEGAETLDEVLGPEATAILSAAADSIVDGNARTTLGLADGRSLNVSVAEIGERTNGTLLVLHFHDITESLRLRELERDEMNQAANVQRALLPDILPDTPGWTYGTSTTPASQVGGDFFDLRVRTPKVVVSLGDVMGKGVGAGMLASAIRAVLRSHDPTASPAQVVTDTARVLEGDLRRMSGFVTLAYVLVDMETGEFKFTDAGHGLYFIARGESGETERIASDDMPVGLGEQWREISGNLAPGDTILLVSDGVLDLWGGSVEELQAAIARSANREGISPQAFVDELCAAATGDHHDGDDDVTAVALRRER